MYIREENILILSSLEPCLDLLEKKARLYSDRYLTEMMKLYVLNNFVDRLLRLIHSPALTCTSILVGLPTT